MVKKGIARLMAKSQKNQTMILSGGNVAHTSYEQYS
jgi:hypothetical protein